ncbi:Nucleic-acid-binding protein from transposon X-element [Formica fusca]
MRNQRQPKIDTYWLSSPVQTSNRFDALEKEDQQTQQTELDSPEEKMPKPPPIYVDRVSNIQPLTDLLKDTVNGEFEIKILKAEEVKIQPRTTQAYSTIVKELQNKGTEFHTYRLKQDRNFRVVLKNIHPSTDASQLKTAIEILGHQVTNLWNIRSRSTKKPLCSWLISSQASTISKSIMSKPF